MKKSFDQFAAWSARCVAHAWFFTACVVSCIVWVPTYFLFESIDTWQLIINTYTTVVTFLLVALLQNSQQRFEDDVNRRENVMIEAVSILLDTKADDELRHKVAKELRSCRRETA